MTARQGDGGRDGASYRDRTAVVHHVAGEVVRGLRGEAARAWRVASERGLVERLVSQGMLIPSKEVDASALPAETGSWELALVHPRLDVVSYPWEWPFSMLRDAGLLQLGVLRSSLDKGLRLKDGSADNVQWTGSRPVFTDAGSFTLTPGPWAGYPQFCETVLFPLLVEAHVGQPIRVSLGGSPKGVPASEARLLLRGRHSLHRGVLRHVHLQALLAARSSRPGRDVADEMVAAGYDDRITDALAAKLAGLLTRLRSRRRRSAWSAYAAGVDADVVELKKKVVAGAVAGARMVLDLACNDGTYAFVAARGARAVVAVDRDDVCVDALYRRAVQDGVHNVLPLVADVSDAAPPPGWRGDERRALAQRVDPDVVLALALVHHLSISGNIPLEEIVTWLREFGSRVVVEFVHPEDPQAARLLASKGAGQHDDYSLATFELLVRRLFVVDSAEVLPGGTRTLYVLEPA